MPDKPSMTSDAVAVPNARRWLRILAIACMAAALVVAVLAVGGPRSVDAQEGSACPVTDLGALGVEADGGLNADGRWTTENCDSRFRTGSDAHSYRFEVVEAGRIRIDLVSGEGDSFLYLLAEDERRLTDNDDGGAGLDARIERDLTPGIYVVEATTVGGRGRGPADFSLSIGRVTGCEPVHLGSLEPGVDLTASGSWTLDTCGSRFVVEHPAYGYLFDLPQDGHVRVDLMSESGDPVLSLVSTSVGLIAANDDGGERRNSRIDRYLESGTYLLEATTYLERDYQPLMADFTLVVHLVDEQAGQNSFLLKIEDVHTPEHVVAGQPFSVHYRVGNLGGGDLADIGGNAVVYVVGPRVFERTAPIAASEMRWGAGVSYHTGEPAANSASLAIEEVSPFEVTLGGHGPSWVFVGVVTFDENDEERGFHGQWQNVMVLSGTTFDPVTVSVDARGYNVSAEADDEGMVTASVTAFADPDAEVDAATQAKAMYAAGVRTQLLEGIFERPAIAGLAVTGTLEAFSLPNPASDTLLASFGGQFEDAVAELGLAESLAAGEAINPVTVEELALNMAGTAASRYLSLQSSWRSLQARLDAGGTMSFAEALTLHAQLGYVERMVTQAVAAGDVVRAARSAGEGWQDPGVGAMVGDLAEQVSCGNAAASLRSALSGADAADVDALLDLDVEMRTALPVYGVLIDGMMCAARSADGETFRFLNGLAVADSPEVLELLGLGPDTGIAQPPLPLRILARLTDGGRIEHAVELPGGEQVLPSSRLLPVDAPPGEWRVSSDVEVDGQPIGKIRSRRLADGRTELGFLRADGESVVLDIRYLPRSMPLGVWLRSGEFEVTPVGVLE